MKQFLRTKRIDLADTTENQAEEASGQKPGKTKQVPSERARETQENVRATRAPHPKDVLSRRGREARQENIKGNRPCIF